MTEMAGKFSSPVLRAVSDHGKWKKDHVASNVSLRMKSLQILSVLSVRKYFGSRTLLSNGRTKSWEELL